MANVDDEDVTLELAIDIDSEHFESDNDDGEIGEISKYATSRFCTCANLKISGCFLAHILRIFKNNKNRIIFIAHFDLQAYIYLHVHAGFSRKCGN